MPSKKKKYNARFPAGRIKKIMQTDEDVGKVAQAVPIIISKTLELFIESLLTKTMLITNAKNAKTLSPSHMKQCILSESRFDFLKDLVESLPDVSGPDEETPTPPLTPAPAGIHPMSGHIGVITHGQSQRVQKDALLHRKAVQMPSPLKNGTEVIHKTETIKQESSALSPSRVPNFQISMPSSFYGGQPNFYTELNPMNLSTQQNTSVPIKQESSNFGYSAHMDEDYDA